MNTLETKSTQSYEEFIESLTHIPESLKPEAREIEYTREPAPLDKNDIVICYPYRTGFGTFSKGTLAETSATEIGSKLVNELLDKTGRSDIRRRVGAVYIGMINHESMNPAGEIAKNSGIDIGSAVTLNTACASGLRSVLDAASAVRDRENTGVELAVAGGFESMSNTSDRISPDRNGRGFGDRVIHDGILVSLADVFEKDAKGRALHMGVIGGRTEPGRPPVDRRAADIYAFRSQQLAAMVEEANYFDERILRIEVEKNRKTVVFGSDESVKGRIVTMEGLTKLRPAFEKDGDVTAGNASGLSDGGGAMIVTYAENAEKLGLEIAARLESGAIVGVKSEYMGTGPIYSTEKALERAGLKISDIDSLYLNEAFAHVALMGGYALGATYRNLNRNGGAIAHGHPTGGTGAMLTVNGVSDLDNNPEMQNVAVTLCVGGGQGITGVFGRVAA